MRSIRNIFTFLVLSASLPLLAAPPEEWFHCEKDADCVDISYPCSGATVNVKFATEADSHYKKLNSQRDCMTSPEDRSGSLPFKVFCREKRCEKQGKNPKVGFS